MKKWLQFTPIGAALIYLLLAIIHRLGIDSPGYTSSPLIGFLIIGLVLFLLLIFVLMVMVCVFLLAGERKMARTTFINFIVTLLIVWLAVGIDAPTILYMT